MNLLTFIFLLILSVVIFAGSLLLAENIRFDTAIVRLGLRILPFVGVGLLIFTIIFGIASCGSALNAHQTEIERRCQTNALYKKGEKVGIKTSDKILLVAETVCSDSGRTVKYKLVTPEVTSITVEQELLEKR